MVPFKFNTRIHAYQNLPGCFPTDTIFYVESPTNQELNNWVKDNIERLNSTIKAAGGDNVPLMYPMHLEYLPLNDPNTSPKVVEFNLRALLRTDLIIEAGYFYEANVVALTLEQFVNALLAYTRELQRLNYLLFKDTHISDLTTSENIIVDEPFEFGLWENFIQSKDLAAWTQEEAEFIEKTWREIFGIKEVSQVIVEPPTNLEKKKEQSLAAFVTSNDFKNSLEMLADRMSKWNKINKSLNLDDLASLAKNGDNNAKMVLYIRSMKAKNVQNVFKGINTDMSPEDIIMDILNIPFFDNVLSSFDSTKGSFINYYAIQIHGQLSNFRKTENRKLKTKESKISYSKSELNEIDPIGDFTNSQTVFYPRPVRYTEEEKILLGVNDGKVRCYSGVASDENNVVPEQDTLADGKDLNDVMAFESAFSGYKYHPKIDTDYAGRLCESLAKKIIQFARKSYKDTNKYKDADIERNLSLFKSYFGISDADWHEVAKGYGINPSRVYQIVDDIMKKLQKQKEPLHRLLFE